MDDRVFISKSVEETKKIAYLLAQEVKQGGVIALYGDLGAGKTTFVQGFAEGLGINRRIISPTFVIIRTYELSENRMFYHIDLYRVSESNTKELGLEEILSNPHNIVAIEWAEKIENMLSQRFNVQLTYVNEQERNIRIRKSI